VYEGLRIESQPEHPYWSVGGKSIRVVNCDLPGISPQIGAFISYENCLIREGSEPDKDVEELHIWKCEFLAGIRFPSSSIQNVLIEDCRFHGLVNLGAKNNVVKNSTFMKSVYFATYGLTESSAFIGSTFFEPIGLANYGIGGNFPFSDSQYEEGAVKYVDGIISFSKRIDPKGFAPVPGQRIWPLAGVPHQYYPLPVCGKVTAITDDAEFVFVHTDLPKALPPAFGKYPKFSRENCKRFAYTSCTIAGDAQDVHSVDGYHEGALHKFRVTEDFKPLAPFALGYLRSIVVEVVDPFPIVANPKLKLLFPSVFGDDLSMFRLDCIFDLGKPGKAMFGRSEFEALSGRKQTDFWVSGGANSLMCSLEHDTHGSVKGLATITIELDPGPFSS
jgi:hypothetical protein